MITEDDLWVNEEFSVLCDGCGMNESTRDSYKPFAIDLAKKEGFIKTLGGLLLCPDCQRKESE